jgi:serine/threonine-protein kinase
MEGRIFFGRYQVAHLLGEGGMGRVYLARQLQSGRPVVIKILHDHIANQPQVRESFQQEMLFMARFKHPHAVALIEGNLKGPDGPCIVMEYIRGLTLDQILQKHRRLSPLRTGRLVAQLCLALHAAHNLGIIHRDLKPANLMVEGPDTAAEKLKVMDLGLAKLSRALYIPMERLSNPDQFFSACGTPDYMCPEQVRGDELDHRSDLYSVGIILYEMLTGQLPFQRESMQDTLLAHAEERPPRFAKMGVGNTVTPAVEEVVMACLSKFPNERPQNALELAQRYQKALGLPILNQEQAEHAAQQSSAVVAVKINSTAPRKLHPDAEVYHMDAWMPERIAVVKLKGFVDDIGGQVIESVPGMIRVRLPFRIGGERPRGGVGLLTRLGLSRQVEQHVELALHMEKRPEQQNRLRMTVILWPEKGRALARDPNWLVYCDAVHHNLRAYVIGHDG